MAEAKAITTHVLEYFEEHARTGSSLESIATWWMMRQQWNESLESVHAALNQLRSAGVITDHTTPDGHTIYFLSGRRVVQTPHA